MVTVASFYPREQNCWPAPLSSAVERVWAGQVTRGMFHVPADIMYNTYLKAWKVSEILDVRILAVGNAVIVA